MEPDIKTEGLTWLQAEYLAREYGQRVRCEEWMLHLVRDTNADEGYWSHHIYYSRALDLWITEHLVKQPIPRGADDPDPLVIRPAHVVEAGEVSVASRLGIRWTNAHNTGSEFHDGMAAAWLLKKDGTQEYGEIPAMPEHPWGGPKCPTGAGGYGFAFPGTPACRVPLFVPPDDPPILAIEEPEDGVIVDPPPDPDPATVTITATVVSRAPTPTYGETSSVGGHLCLIHNYAASGGTTIQVQLKVVITSSVSGIGSVHFATPYKDWDADDEGAEHTKTTNISSISLPNTVYVNIYALPVQSAGEYVCTITVTDPNGAEHTQDVTIPMPFCDDL